MGKLSVEAFTLSGPSVKSSWAQAHELSERVEKKGKIFVCISVQGPDDFDARLVGRKILSTFEEEYYSTNDSPYKSLLRCLSTVALVLPDMATDASKLFFDLTAAVFYQEVMYVGVMGAGGAKIYRNGKLSDLFKKERTMKEPSVASGYVRVNDILLLYTSSFLLDITKEELEKNLSESNLASDVSDRLAPYLMKGEKPAAKAALVLCVVEREEVEKAEENTFDLHEEISETSKQIVQKPAEKNGGESVAEGLKSNFWGLVRRGEPEIFLKRETGQEKSRKMTFTIAVVLLFMLFGSVFWGIRKRDDEAFRKNYTALYKDASDKYDEGASLLELNPNLSKLPLTAAKDKAEELVKLVGEGRKEKAEVTQLVKKIDDALMGAIKTYNVSEPALFYDLTILGDKAEGSEWNLYDNNALIFDRKNVSGYVVGLTGKSGGVVAGGDDLKGVNIFAMGEKKAYFLGDKGVSEVNVGEKGMALIIKKDDGWGEVSSMAVFGGNLYLLDKTNSKVWKYVGGENGFLSRANYFSSSVNPDLSKAIKILIDGSVWILGSDGSLYRYTTGKLDPINLSGLSDNLGELSDFYVDATLKYVYILDKVKKRIVLFDKQSGVYNSQYVWDGMDKIMGIGADESAKKIFLLDGAKIYAVDLK